MLQKTESVLSTAAKFLVKQDPEARFRLRDILVEEVSFVDRAANRRRFLVVKHRGGTPMGQHANKVRKDDEDPNAPGQGAGSEGEDPNAGDGAGDADKQDVMLPTSVKEGLLRILTEALERLVSVTNEVKGAEESSDESETPMPEDMGEEIGAIVELLRGALSRYPSPTTMSAPSDPTKKLAEIDGMSETRDKLIALAAVMEQIADAPDPDTVQDIMDRLTKSVSKSEGEVSQTLREIGGRVHQLAIAADSQESLTDDTKKEIKQLSEKMSEVISEAAKGDGTGDDAGASGDGDTTGGGDSGGDTTGDGAGQASKTDPGQGSGDGGGEDIDADLSGLVDQLGKAAKTGKKSKVVTALRAMLDALDGGGEGDGAGAGSGDGSGDGDQTQKQLDKQTVGNPDGTNSVGKMPDGDDRAGKPNGDDAEEFQNVVKRVEELSEEVKKLKEKPQPPASRSEPGAKPGDDKDEPAASGKNGGRRGGPWVW